MKMIRDTNILNKIKCCFREKAVNSLFLLLALFIVWGCYHGKRTKTHSEPTQTGMYKGSDFESDSYMQRLDSASFSRKHHYYLNYNFIVKDDSIILLRQQPEEILNDMPTDTLVVHRHDHLVVADIRIISSDKVDSVWVQVARDQSTFGWIHESALLQGVVPNDPISQFISIFSDTHLLVFLIIISVISVAYLLRTVFKRNAKIVHFNDINSFYPTFLALLVALSATIYSSIQLFAPDTWRHFYFHPSLNPFDEPMVLCVFLISVWAMLIVGIAVVDIVRHTLPVGEALLYLCGLASVCAINYIIFSVTTIYYVGYILLAAYIFFAISRYFKFARCVYVCGKCGARLCNKGRCPYCGALNT